MDNMYICPKCGNENTYIDDTEHHDDEFVDYCYCEECEAEFTVHWPIKLDHVYTRINKPG